MLIEEAALETATDEGTLALLGRFGVELATLELDIGVTALELGAAELSATELTATELGATELGVLLATKLLMAELCSDEEVTGGVVVPVHAASIITVNGRAKRSPQCFFIIIIFLF